MLTINGPTSFLLKVHCFPSHVERPCWQMPGDLHFHFDKNCTWTISGIKECLGGVINEWFTPCTSLQLLRSAEVVRSCTPFKPFLALRVSNELGRIVTVSHARPEHAGDVRLLQGRGIDTSWSHSYILNTVLIQSRSFLSFGRIFLHKRTHTRDSRQFTSIKQESAISTITRRLCNHSNTYFF